MLNLPAKYFVLLLHFAQITATLHVTDLHSVTPDSFLEIAGGSLNALSYQQARNNSSVVGLVYVADPGDMLVSCTFVSQGHCVFNRVLNMRVLRWGLRHT